MNNAQIIKIIMQTYSIIVNEFIRINYFRNWVGIEKDKVMIAGEMPQALIN